MKKVMPILAILSLLLLPGAIGAQDILDQGLTPMDAEGNMEFFAKDFGQDKDGTDLVGIIGNIVKIVLTLLGVIVLVIIVYAGFLWMTAGGNEDQVKKAKQWLINAIIGLALVLSAYAISSFVVTNLSSATTVAN
ncbi:hypothetical protein HN858_02810 [Candidatus Falkowbacteria bacterium]|jgi:lysylphosphatidylglycerol synthetase-like protein (DUF2156 family)|nr:hypothetical protein [Candidatus Falkowbacteria bacterium]MBT5503420.1 hypothetical protein [Candidatus Falkowbacteria bacterium]MBT6574017.1 hypothetical protein [Candidatus Falkowbacteria bacterium]MBT7348587.1 hypothetical protein [Candidatus Falkowbacteria bacterium]MBT7500377.1 hypothetical protein [Candidatus Falkowbacteria bacterium]